MIAMVLSLQIALPLALLLWLALVLPGSALGLALLAAGVAACLLALARIARRALRVWWLPWLYAGPWLLIVGTHLIRTHPGGPPPLPAGTRGSAGTGLALVLPGLGGWHGGRAPSGRTPPPGQIVDIANPFGAGACLVGHGGSNTLVSGHMRTLDPAIERFRPRRDQSCAKDFFGLGQWGLRATGGRPSDTADHTIFRAPLPARCAGTGIRAEGNRPDREAPDSDRVDRVGNHVILRCGGAGTVFAHMRQGSVTVAAGGRVAVGDPLAEGGNSGASIEPHQHIDAQRAAPEGPALLPADPPAPRIDGRVLACGDRLSGLTD